MMATFLKLGSLRYLLPFCVFKYFSFFSSCKSSCARVPVVFYLNVSKKGKKQDVNDDCSKRHLKNIILLNIDLCACVCACVRACLCFKE